MIVRESGDSSAATAAQYRNSPDSGKWATAMRVEIVKIEQKYQKEREAIIDALVSKEIALLVEKYEKEKQMILEEIKHKTTNQSRS